jgi:hypothetical protein
MLMFAEGEYLFINRDMHVSFVFICLYSIKKLIFLVNVVDHPLIAKDYNINTTGVSRQLPTLIMFENGVEVGRFPAFNDDGKIGKVLKYDRRTLAKYFDLENRYFETMSL